MEQKYVSYQRDVLTAKKGSSTKMDSTMPDQYNYDAEDINYDDIPEITDFSSAVRNPYWREAEHPVVVKIKGATIEELEVVAQQQHSAIGDVVDNVITKGLHSLANVA